MTILMTVLYSLFSFAQEYNSPVIMVTTSREDLRKNGCWATLYEGKNFTQSEMTVFNGKDIPDFEFSAGPIWRERIHSVVAGPAARISLYSKELYRGEAYHIHPLEKIADIPLDEIHSLKLTCVTLQELKRRDDE